MRRLLLLTLALLLFVSAPWLAGAWERNQAARAVQSACLSTEAESGLTLEGATRLDAGARAWFQAVRTRCQGDAEDARAAWDAALAASPARLSLLKAASEEDPALAQAAALRYPEHPEALFWLAETLLEEGETGHAREVYERGLALEPEHAAGWLALGGLYEQAGDWDAAVRAYDQACLYVDGGKNGCPRAGRMYLERGFYALAADRYRTTLLQLGYAWSPAEVGLARSLYGLGRTGEALEILEPLAARGDGRAIDALEDFQSEGLNP